MAYLTEYSFHAKIASRGYYVFKETTWNNVKEEHILGVDLETNKLSRNVDPDSSSEEEDLHVGINFDETIDLAID